MKTELFRDRVEFEKLATPALGADTIDRLRQHGIHSIPALKAFMESRRWKSKGFCGNNKARMIYKFLNIAIPDSICPIVPRALKPRNHERARRIFRRMKPLELRFTLRAGLYALLSNGRVMYIGQTVNVFRRVGMHIEAKPPFDAVLFFELKKPTLNKLLCCEQDLISFLKPPWNFPPFPQLP